MTSLGIGNQTVRSAKNRSNCLHTTVERTSRFLQARKLHQVTAGGTLTAQKNIYADLPAHAVSSVTVDNGSEFAHHYRLADSLGVPTYFCDPYSAWLGPDESVEDTVSLETWVSDLEPGSGDLALQMDIEGAEYPNLASVPLSVLKRFRIMVIELHGLAEIATNPLAFWQEKGDGLANLMRNHVVVHAHPNNCCGSVTMDIFPFEMPKVLEISLLRKDRVKRWAIGQSDKFQSPHREDIGWNVAKNRPLFLGEHWIRAGMGEQTRIRRAAIEAAWLYEQRLQMQNGTDATRTHGLV